MKEKIVIVNFDKLPDDVSGKRGRDRLLTIYDGKEIIDFLCYKIQRGHIDTMILRGYLPTAMWIEVGAFFGSQTMHICVKYQPADMSPVHLPIASGDSV